MKITETNEVEQSVIELFEKSNQKVENENTEVAQKQIKFILSCFDFIQAFTGVNHKDIVKVLYFSKNNIAKVGVSNMNEFVFVQERTLFNYRKKYVAVLESAFAFMKDINFND